MSDERLRPTEILWAPIEVAAGVGPVTLRGIALWSVVLGAFVAVGSSPFALGVALLLAAVVVVAAVPALLAYALVETHRE